MRDNPGEERIIDSNIDSNRAGILYGFSAFTLWGLLPLYWKLLDNVPAFEILTHRIFWSFIFMGLVAVSSGRKRVILDTFRDKKKLLLIFCCGFVISLNWFTYIYAVNSGFVVEASMGYYINPLVVVLLGVTVFREPLGRWKSVALVLAALGVLIIALQYGRVPWIALSLAFTFATYGLIKKIISLDPVSGLVLETFIVMPAALFLIVNLEVTGSGALGTLPFAAILLLAGTGVVTATPLFLYARGIEKTTFSMMGFLQYIAPTITLFLGIFIFGEFFSLPHLVSFCFIWLGLAIFTMANVGILKDPLPAGAGETGLRGDFKHR